MNFATDRDLMILEPNLFRDLPFLSQQRFDSMDGILTQGHLNCASADFVTLGISTGDVVQVKDQPLEILARIDATHLHVSLIRATVIDASIPPANTSDAKVVIRSFHAQLTAAHDMLLQMLGLDRDDPEQVHGEDAIISTTLMTRLETIATLERLYTAAQTLSGDNQMVESKAEHYRKAFRRTWLEARIAIDQDGDGIAERTCQPAVSNLKRGA